MDTLEITKKLEGAGFERRQAEAVASIVSAGAGARDEQLDDLRGRVGKVEERLTKVEERLTKVESGLESLGHKIDGGLESLGHKIDGGLASQGHRLEGLIARAQFQMVVWTVGALGVLFALMRLLP